MKKITYLLAFGLLFTGSISSAQDSSNPANTAETVETTEVPPVAPAPTRTPVLRTDRKAEAVEMMEQRQEQREENAQMREEMRVERQADVAEIQAVREEAREEMAETREKAKETRESARETRSSAREDRQETRAKVQTEIRTKRGEIVARLTQNIIIRLEASVQKFRQIITRITTASADLTDPHKGQVENALTEANRYLSEVENNIETLKGLVANWSSVDVNSEDFVTLLNDQKDQIRSTVRLAHDNLKNAGAQVREASKALREGKMPNTEPVTSSDTEETNPDSSN